MNQQGFCKVTKIEGNEEQPRGKRGTLGNPTINNFKNSSCPLFSSVAVPSSGLVNNNFAKALDEPERNGFISEAILLILKILLIL